MIDNAVVKASQNGAKNIDVHLPAAATLFRHALHQCSLTVLDSAADCQNSVTTLGRDAGGLEYVSTLFSEHAAYRIRICAHVKQMAQPADANGRTRNPNNVDRDLSFPVFSSPTGSSRCTIGKPNPLASQKSSVVSRPALLHSFREQSSNAKLVFTVTTSLGN